MCKASWCSFCGIQYSAKEAEEVRRRFGVENLEHRLRKMRLRWFGHVKHRDENSILRRAMELEVESRRPLGRPKKTWGKVT